MAQYTEHDQRLVDKARTMPFEKLDSLIEQCETEEAKAAIDFIYWRAYKRAND